MSGNKDCRAARRGRKKTEVPVDLAKRKTLKQIAALSALALLDVGVFSSCGPRAVSSLSKEQKVLVLGFDGLDHRIVQRLMLQGKLPNMSRLAQMGSFGSITSSNPPQSPVAWANFITGRDPGGHNIFDFIHRDPKTYLPYLSIARAEEAKRNLSFGKWKVPISQSKIELLRKGPAFWDLLTERGIPASVYYAPTNFPPNDTGAKQVAGLGAPDLRGTYGEFTYFTEAPFPHAEKVSGGTVEKVKLSNDHARLHLRGPDNAFQKEATATTAEIEVWIDRDHKVAKIVGQGEAVLLKEGEWSDWLPVSFEMVPRLKSITGICRFYLKEVSPYFKLYASPVNIDPRDPALPVTAPASFSRELADRYGRFYTQGFPYDVKALRHGVLNEDEYLQQSAIATGEVCRIYEGALNDFNRGLLFFYFSESDRTQHMFWHVGDPRHPAYDPKLAPLYSAVIEEQCYQASDTILGQALDVIDDRTTLIVMSDHGFAPYYRSFNVNTWLKQNGFLVGSDLHAPGANIFANADWGQTMAYGIGFNGLYLNQQGREVAGCVGQGNRDNVLQQLIHGLEQVRDPETGKRVIVRVSRADEIYSPEQRGNAPDLIIGYAPGYRCADESVLGEITPALCADNRDKWSGDHCIDFAHVPGIILANKPIQAEAPALEDVTTSVLSEFGIQNDAGMIGKSIWRG